jgi:hypothetical protein
LLIVGEVLRKKFESHIPAETGVFGFVDHTHPSAAKFVGNGIVRKLCDLESKTGPP